MKKKVKIEEIPVKSIRGNEHLSVSVTIKEMERHERTIQEYGLKNPLVVQEYQQGQYKILYGECERRVLVDIKERTTPAVIVEDLDEVEATRLSLLLLSLQYKNNAISEGLLLRELLNSGSYTQAEMGHILGRSVSWINKRLSLVERLASSVLELVQNGVMSAETAQGIARMPGEVQQTFANKVINDAVPKSTVEKLVSYYNNPGATETLKKTILDNPWSALGFIKEVQTKRGPKTARAISLSEKLRTNYRILSRGIDELEGYLARMSAEDKETTKKTWQEYVSLLERFSRLIKINME